MIVGTDALVLGHKLCAASEHVGERVAFKVDPSKLTARICNRDQTPAPFLTMHGGGDDVAELIQSYHQWGEPIVIGMYNADGLCQFWVEQSDPD